MSFLSPTIAFKFIVLLPAIWLMHILYASEGPIHAKTERSENEAIQLDSNPLNVFFQFNQ